MPVRTTSGILSEIVDRKKQEIAALHDHAVLFEQQAFERKHPARLFLPAIRERDIAIIAEIKKASPSKGVIAQEFHPALMAHAYEKGGAACLSVLTDHDYFQGSLHDLEAARAACTIPVLRKDFTLDRIQIYQAAAHGADAILLIAAILSEQQLREFRELAQTLHLAALVEVHDHEELKRAIDSGADFIGVNNRDLGTFQVSLETSLRLSYRMPANAIRVSESGIRTKADINVLRDAGFHAFLVGESLMKSHNPTLALRELVGTHHEAQR